MTTRRGLATDGVYTDRMRSPLSIASIVSLSIVTLGTAVGLAQRASAPGPSTASAADTTSRIVKAAQTLIAQLDEGERGKLQFRFDDQAQRVRWSNLPSPMFQRVGLRLGDITPAKRGAVMSLLQAALSADGYKKINEIMDGDEVLRETGGGNGPRGNPPLGGANGARAGRGRGGPGGGAPGGGGGPAFGRDN